MRCAVISMKDYAAEQKISYEAVRKQVNRYRSELEDHIVKQGRTQYLDDDAVAFLDERRQENPIIILESSKDEEIQRLSNENKALLLKLTEVQDKLVRSQETISELQTEKLQLQQEKILLLEEKKEPEPAPHGEEDPASAAVKKSWWKSLFKRK